MTRKEFLNTMVKSILGYSIIEFKKQENDKVEYTKTGTLIKDCTYTQHYHDKVVELICSIFDENVKKFKTETENKSIEAYQNNARKFLYNICNKSLEENVFDNMQELLYLNFEKLKHIYEFIIIDEIFHVEYCGKKVGNDDFDDSVNKIIKMINEYLYKVGGQKNCSAVDDTEYNEFKLEIFYKSSELGKRFANIKEYLKIKKCNFIILNNNNVTNFQQNTIYRYTGECFFEVGERNEIITYFKYNNQRIQSYTSTHNWLNMSILCNYVYTGASRYFNCYFFYDQGRMFKFLQISEAAITAEI